MRRLQPSISMDINRIITPNYGTNCYLLSGVGFAAVIDPGEVTPELLEFVNEESDTPEKRIILTHCHFDHIEGVNAVNELWNAPVIISADEAEGLCDNSINLSGYWSRDAISIVPDKTVTDGDEIMLGNEKLKVIVTPGHTKGSVCYLWKDILFSGDTLFKVSIGRTDLPTASATEIFASLKRLSELDENITVLPGHGENTTIGYEKRYNPYMR